MFEVMVLLLLGFVIYLERRLSQLEEQVRESHSPSYEPPILEFPRPPAVVIDSSPPATVEPAFEPQVMVEPEPEPEPEPMREAALVEPEQHEDIWEEAPPEERRPSFSFEEWFGRRLPIWAGGITLAIAGVLIVKLSIEAGLVSPTVRVISGLLFGLGLIAGAEAARRFEDRVRDVRIRQALSGAGLASLYASILIAANLYALIPAAVAMVGIAAVTGLAMGLALRFGAPSALLGLAGGLAAPALIGSNEPNVPLLSLYLALAVGGLAMLSRNQRWAWLGLSALVGGFGWGLLLLLGGVLDMPSAISLGLFILLLGIGLPALGLAGDRSQQLQLIAGILGSAQMAALVATGGFAMLNWGLFAALGAASVWLANREPKLMLLPPVGLAIALLLLGAWPNPTVGEVAIVMSGIALIYAPLPLLRLWTARGSLLDAGQIAAIGLGAWLLAVLQFETAISETALGLLALALATAVATVAAVGWRVPDRTGDARFAIVTLASTVLFACAAALLFDESWAGVVIAAIGLGLLHVGRTAGDVRLEPFAWLFALGGFASALVGAVGNADSVNVAVFTALTALAVLFAWRGTNAWAKFVAQSIAPFLAYGAIVLLIDDRFAPVIAPTLLVGLAFAWRLRPVLQLAPAMATSAFVIFAWAYEPLAIWAQAAAWSLVGEPVLVTALPTLDSTFRQLLMPGALAILAFLLARPLAPRTRSAGLAFGGVLVGIALHIFFKHIFAIGSDDLFVARGLAERTVWEVILIAAAAGALMVNARRAALALGAAAAAHLTVYTLVLHNPLWATQAVGPWPIVNLLLSAYALAFGLIVVVSRLPIWDEARPVLASVQMLLIGLFAFSTLRQLFHGSLLVAPGLTQAEDIGRSVLAITLAIGFLLWGIARQERVWRLASLGLMVVAVGKVFLFDASGLEGVTRIASFVALGFSLIGIGWLYSRYLPAAEAQPV